MGWRMADYSCPLSRSCKVGIECEEIAWASREKTGRIQYGDSDDRGARHGRLCRQEAGQFR